jgi:uncharacterized repeat protein (TIGR03847 family)
MMGVFYSSTMRSPSALSDSRGVLAAGPARGSRHREVEAASRAIDYLRKVMSDLPSPADQPLPAAMELAEPVDPVFVLGPIGLGYDRDNDRVLVQLEEVVPVDEEGEPDPEAVEDRGHLRVFLTRGQAAALCSHTETIVAAGRPPCDNGDCRRCHREDHMARRLRGLRGVGRLPATV